MNLHEKAGVVTIPKFLDGISFNENGELALTASNLNGKTWDGVIAVFNDAHFAPNIPHIDNGSLNESGCTAIEWIDIENIVTSTDAGSIEIWKKSESPMLENSVVFAEHSDVCSSISVLKQTKHLLSGSWDGSIKIWDLQTDVALHTIMYHTDKVLDVTWDTNSVGIFCSASEDGTVKVYDNRNEGKPGCLLFHDQISHPTCLSWKSNNYVFAGFSNGEIILLDLRYPCSCPLRVIKAHKKSINKLLSIENLIISASNDFSVKMHNDFECIYENVRHSDYVQDLAFQDDTKSVWSCGWDGVLFEHKIYAQTVDLVD